MSASSLISVLGCWQTIPELSVVIAVATQVSDTLIAATATGWVCLFNLIHSDSSDDLKVLSKSVS